MKFTLKNIIMSDGENPKWVLARYILATTLPFLPLLIALALDPQTARTTPTLFFLPVIALSAWVGGIRKGIVSSVISGIILNYFFLPPYGMLKTSQAVPLLQSILFIAEGILVSTFIDIGKRKDGLRDYKRREKQLNAKIIELETEVLLTRKEIRQRDEFLSIASHELKTPLTSMLLQTQTALHNIRNVSLAQFSIEHLLTMLESVENQTKRLSRMINDLLNVSVMATGNIDLEREKVDLKIIAQDVINDFTDRLAKENYKLTFKPEDSVTGNWDKVRIEQAISNLLSNAIKYGNHHPLLVKTYKKGSIAFFSIQDGGIGVTKEQQKRIFSLFERGVSSEEYKGLGVGLYITHQIIKAHGGTIYVESRVGHGSTFTMELPILKKESKSPEAKKVK